MSTSGATQLVMYFFCFLSFIWYDYRMSNYKVPQDVQREDQILPFATLKQLIILLVTGGASYLMYASLNKQYNLSQLETIFCFVPLMIGAAFAYVRIKGIPLFKFILLVIEQSFFRPGRRFWQPGILSFISITYSTALKKKSGDQSSTSLASGNKKNSAEKIQNLANFLDTK